MHRKWLFSSRSQVTFTGVTLMTAVYCRLTDPHCLWDSRPGQPTVALTPMGRETRQWDFWPCLSCLWCAPGYSPSKAPGCLQCLYFFPPSASFLPNKASLVSLPDCLTAAPDKYPSSWVSIGNKAWPAAGCAYWREIETLFKLRERILNSAGEWRAIGCKEQIRFKE